VTSTMILCKNPSVRDSIANRGANADSLSLRTVV